MSLDFILFHAFFLSTRQYSDDEKSKQQTRLFHSSLKLFLCTGKFKELEREFFFHFGNEFYLIDWLLNYRRMTRWKTKKKLSRRGKNCFRWLNNLERVGFCWVLQFTGFFIHWASHSETFSEAHPTWTCRYLRSLGEISFYFYSHLNMEFFKSLKWNLEFTLGPPLKFDSES